MKVFVVVDCTGYVVGVYRHEDDADDAIARREDQLAKAGSFDTRCYSYVVEVQ
jgi:hypothetical protein